MQQRRFQKEKRKEAQKELLHAKLYFVLIAFVVMLVFSRNSPLYFTNDWEDSNAFMTMGRGILHGLVPYRDLFEQKGPLLYFIHALSALTGPNFYGIWVIEVILMTVNLILFYKIGKIFLSSRLAFVATLFLPALLLGTQFFNTILWFREGDSAEEFAVPCLLFLIFGLCQYLGKARANKQPFPLLFLFGQGLLMGGLFWIKYPLVGPYLAFFVLAALLALGQRQFSYLIKAFLSSLLGFLTISLPILLYFALERALPALFSVYFAFNMQAYRTQTSLVVMGLTAARAFARELVGVPFLIVLLLGFLGLLWRLIKQGKGWLAIFLLLGLGATIFSSFGGGTALPYYFMSLMPFMALGIIGLLLDFVKLVNGRLKGFKPVYLIPLALVLPLLVNRNLFYSRLFPNNSDLGVGNGNMTKQSAQVLFAEKIRRVKRPTLLNYGMLDSGFYLASGVLPNQRYFEQQKLPYQAYPKNNDAQVAVIKRAQVDFVVKLKGSAAQGYGLNPASGVDQALARHYQLVTSHTQTYQGMVKTFELYEKKTLLVEPKE